MYHQFKIIQEDIQEQVHRGRTIEADTAEQAQPVLAERLGFEEDYGFEYTVDHTPIVPGAD